MSKKLQALVDQAYQVFANYRLIGGLQDVCAHCVDEADIQKLEKSFVKDISQDWLSAYNDSAQSEVLDITEFKHFLPRYLDLIAQLDFPSHSAELALKKLGEFNLDQDFKPEEAQLLRDFSEAFFEDCLSRYPLGTLLDLEDILIMFYKAKLPIEALFKIWGGTLKRESLLHFKNLYESLRGGKSSNAFADDLPEYNRILSQWIEEQKSLGDKTEESLFYKALLLDY